MLGESAKKSLIAKVNRKSMALNFSKEMKATMKLAYPVIIGQLGHMMMGVVDSVMVGKIGAAPLAASAIAHGLFMVFMIFGIGLSMAISPLTAMAMGAKKHSECGIVFRQGLLVNLIGGLILTIVIILNADIIRYLNQPEEIIEQGAAYMRILAYSVIPVMIFQTYKQFSEGLSLMRPAMVITLLANIINVFANWVLIYGNLGMPALNLPGAGWATFSTRLLMAVSFLFYVTVSIRYKPFHPSLHTHKLKGNLADYYSFYLRGGFRVLFDFLFATTYAVRINTPITVSVSS